MSLKLRKLDLHVHTPASHDFDNKSVTAEQIIEQAQKVGLDGIAITDHNNVNFVDDAKVAGKKKGFTVFPGIEVSCGGSKNGSIHIIALFDPSRTKDELQKVLGKLDIKGAGEGSFTAKGVSEVIDIIRESDGLPVLAHANSTHGALADITGNPRTDIVKNPHLLAAEATEADFKKPEGKRLFDYLNGKDPTYQRELAVYKASDNRSPDDKGHCLASIGSKFTYFKMGELSLESLRQCFEDRGSRIVQDYEAEKINSRHPRVESIEITGGFLDGQSFIISPGMNSVIGGTGTGKSLLVEFLRFALDRKPVSQTLLQEHKEKLEKQLRVGGTVKVVFTDADGDEYELVRTYDNPKNPYASPITCTNRTSGDKFTGEIASIFPLLIYSQNEILEITRDPQAQLRLLDNFRDYESHENNVSRIVKDLEELDHQFYQSSQKSGGLDALLKQRDTIEEKVKKLKRKLGGNGKKGAADKYLKLAEEKTAIEGEIEEFDTLIAKIEDTVSEFETDTPNRAKTPKGLEEIVRASLSDRYATVVASLKAQEVATRKAKKKAEDSLAEWLKTNKFAQIEKKYYGEIKLQEKQETQETDRKKLTADKKALDTEIETATKAEQKSKELRTHRKGLLDELGKVKAEYFNERTEQAKLITEKTVGKLQIQVQRGDNKTTYVQMLKKLKVGSQAEQKEIENIADLISPVDLVEIVLDKDAKKLASIANLTEQKAENIISELGNPRNLIGTLSLQYKGYPEDRVEISYQKKDGKLYPLSELSMGQKADALIMIALGDGGMPVVIDQPEDALDVPSIWADICSKLRISKHSRQFIFTTHNSSISVSSDSDQFIVLEADGVRGWLARAGSIDQQAIKDDVVGHLEGGYGSLSLKRKKYGL